MVHSGHGRVIAILGVDGSGKSSLLPTLADWLRTYGKVSILYFGSGDGPMSTLRRLIAWGGKVRHGFRSARTEPPTNEMEHNSHNSHSSPPNPRQLRLRHLLDNILIAWERRRSTRRMLRARARGEFVLADRFPQSQCPGGMDGPKLCEWTQHRLWLVRKIAKWEHDVYAYIEDSSPDLVAILVVSPKTAASRSCVHSVDQLEQRIRQLAELEFPKSQVVHIDAEQPLEKVLKDAIIFVSFRSK